MAKYTIYAVTQHEALWEFGIRKASLVFWERKANIASYPGRNGYTAPEFDRLRACLRRHREKSF